MRTLKSICFDAAQGSLKRLTSGQHRHTSAVWQRSGQRFAFQSTQRNGRSNDVWSIDRLRLTARGSSGNLPMAAGGAPSIGTKQVDDCCSNSMSAPTTRESICLTSTRAKLSRFWVAPLLPSQRRSNRRLLDGRRRGTPGDHRSTERLCTTGVCPPVRPIPCAADYSGNTWDVESLVLSPDRTLGAFVVNADGLGQLYLLDVATRRYAQVDTLPAGLLGAMWIFPRWPTLSIDLKQRANLQRCLHVRHRRRCIVRARPAALDVQRGGRSRHTTLSHTRIDSLSHVRPHATGPRRVGNRQVLSVPFLPLSTAPRHRREGASTR